MTEKNLPEVFHDLISGFIDESGVFPHQAIAKRADGQLEMMALTDAFLNRLVAKAGEDDVVELIYGFDRFTRTGQGTEYADCIAGAYFQREIGWRPLVIEYRHDPRDVRPINWSNAFWNAALAKELAQAGVLNIAANAA